MQLLSHETDAKGRRFEIIRIQQAPKASYEGKRLTLSYLNFYFVNEGIVLPIFGGVAEETVLVAEFDLDQLETQRIEWGIFRDRRPDLYKIITSYDGELTV